ncbi:MAG TPA: serine/threonine-protein kinase, partial [Roseiflexaceae bacterium]|nr:serine/threonine-protein kinase [Roseiflexaceae bacterium]
MASVAPPTTGTAMAEVQQILCPLCHKPNLRRARFCQHCGGDVVLNNDGPRYYITRIIKEGGQGAVYETIGDDGKVYAVKEMLDRFTDPKERDEAIDRFEAEAKMLRRLAHPRIPKIYADFKDEGRQYLAMDFVRGEDMEEVIRRSPGGLPEQQVLAWAAEIFDVLEYLHNHKPEPIIFRDMKPSNVMIEPDGNLKLIDFGIAKVFQHAQRGTQIGTPGYAPPEQYQGLATIESDIYALAATLHHALTGRDPRDEPPFSFPPAYGLKPTISKRTSEALQKALQMNQEDRYQSIAEFRAALFPPPPPPQVRVSQKTTTLPPQPQVAATATAPARPPAPAPQPAAVQARPAAPAVPIAAPAPAAQPRRRGGFLRGLLLLMLVLGLVAATLVFA